MNRDQPAAAFAPTEFWLPDVFALHGRIRGDRPALRQGERVLDWRSFAAAVDDAAATLGAGGLQPGQRVAMLARTTLDAVVWQFGAIRAGGAVVAISTAVSDDALTTMLDDAETTIVIADADQAGRLSRLKAVGSRALIDADAAPPPRSAPFTPPEIDGEDVLAIMYSSGTTGRPKGIVLTHRSRLAYGSIMTSAVGADADTVTLVTTPLCSNMSWTSLIFTLLEGGVAIIHPKFDPVAFVRDVDAHQVSHVLMVPTQFQRILDEPAAAAASLASLRGVFTTGSAMSPALKERTIARFGGAFAEMYGMTEGFASFVRGCDMAAYSDTAGRAMRGNDIRVIDDLGCEVAAGHAGEIVARSPMLMRGYYNDPVRTAEAMWIEPNSGRQFLRSGDIGRIEGDGVIRLVGRKKDMIISGGQNIYAIDLEQILGGHPQVRDAAVIGVPDPQWGEKPLALVVPSSAGAISAQELRDWANAKLGRHQRIAAVEFRDVLARNDGGKLVKADLRAPYWSQSS